LQELLDGRPGNFQKYVQSKFKGEPIFNYASPLQKQRLLYEIMGFEVKVRNKPTENMKAAGLPGSPKTDALAMAYAIRDAKENRPELVPVLEAMRLMAMVTTRRTLYYNKYPYFPHWKDGRVHSNHNQSSTNTRRASSSKPNLQQLPKSAKIEGQEARFREIIVPHRPDAVVVSMDFSAQELRIIADYSRDPNMVACYVGDNLKDLHALTGLGIAQRLQPDAMWTYETFIAALEDEHHPQHKFVKQCRKDGKNTNFGAEFGAMAPKLAQMLMVSEEVAQAFLDAKEETFPVSAQWKQDVIEETKRTGISRTKMGAVRHLREALMSEDRFISSKAERQGVNFRVQGSAAEMTKMAEGRMWDAGLFFKYDAVCYGPIHDEVVASVRVCDLFEFLPEMHACMVAQYADMWIPVESSISFGKDFYNQHEIGKLPTREAIEKGLAEMNKPEKEAA
jgi:DNA polymerase-1